MSGALPFSEEHRDCLQELCNVAMGAAGESLADFAKVFVNLSIPKIRYIQPSQISEALSSLHGVDRVSSAAQFFSMGEHGGYSMVVITDPSFEDLASTTGRELVNDEARKQLLLDLTLCINNTCLPQLAELMESSIEVCEPDLLSLHVPLEQLAFTDIASWDHVVSVEINYHLEDHPFNCDLLLLLPDEVVEALVEALESLLND
ncbi:hypothetical protein [Aurantivibrio plasticivorans]